MTQPLVSQMDDVAGIAEKYPDFAESTAKEIEELKKGIRQFKAYAPFLGEFSVGKSSLLNAWLGEKLLPEAQAPTTALATELRPGGKPEMVIVMDSGAEKHLTDLPKDEEDANAPEASSGAYAYCSTPAANLEKIAPFIPVDMPGINSGIKRHTEALYRYANRGAAFFLVFSPEQGTLPATMEAFLQELDLGRRPVWIILTKCDKVTEEKAQEVLAHIQNQLRDIGIEARGALTLSKVGKDTPEALTGAFLGLKPNELNFLRHAEDALRITLRLRNKLCDLCDSDSLDLGEIDRQIKICQRAREDLDREIQKQEKALRRRLASLPDKVGADVLDSLYANQDGLVTALRSGEDVFAAKMAGIINNVVSRSIDNNLQKDLTEFAKNLAAGLHFEDGAFSGDKLLQSMNMTKNMLTGLTRILEGAKVSGKVYKVVAGMLAITTNIVAPVVELIIFFMPELLSLFCDTEENKRQKLGEALRSRVFPDIQQQIIVEVRQLMPEMEKNLFDELNRQWHERLEDAEAALESARKGRRDAEEEAKKRRERITGDIGELERVIQSLKAVESKNAR